MRRPQLLLVAVLALLAASVALRKRRTRARKRHRQSVRSTSSCSTIWTASCWRGCRRARAAARPRAKRRRPRRSRGEAAEPQNPLAKIAERMRSVENRIAEHDTSAATQEKQALIVERFGVIAGGGEKGPATRQATRRQGLAVGPGGDGHGRRDCRSAARQHQPHRARHEGTTRDGGREGFAAPDLGPFARKAARRDAGVGGRAVFAEI